VDDFTNGSTGASVISQTGPLSSTALLVQLQQEPAPQTLSIITTLGKKGSTPSDRFSKTEEVCFDGGVPLQEPIAELRMDGTLQEQQTWTRANSLVQTNLQNQQHIHQQQQFRQQQQAWTWRLQ
jgi:hypothetical protein